MKTLLPKKLILVLPILLLAMGGCEKDKLTAKATIINTGSIASDGCDWIVKIGSVAYHPDDLKDSYKVDNLNVDLNYITLSTKFQCGLQPISAQNPGMTVIHITKIKKAD